MKLEFEITIDLGSLEAPAKRKRKKKPVESDTLEADEYAHNDKVWNSDVTPGYYKG